MTAQPAPAEFLPPKCRGCGVLKRGACAALNVDQLRVMDRWAVRRSISPATNLFLEEDELTTHLSITKGIVQLSKGLDDGREQIVSLKYAPCHISAVTNPVATVTARTVTEVEVCAVPARLLDHFVSQSPKLENHILRQAVLELEYARTWLLSLGRKNAIERVASFILMVMSHAPDVESSHTGGRDIALPLSRSDMADFLGLTMETISRNISELKRMNLIGAVNGRNIHVLDVRRLKRIAGFRNAPH